MANKISFVLYGELEEYLDGLPDSEVGKLFRAVLHYVNTGKVQQLSGEASMAFKFVRAQLDRDKEKWEDTRRKRAEAGRQGADARWSEKE